MCWITAMLLEALLPRTRSYKLCYHQQMKAKGLMYGQTVLAIHYLQEETELPVTLSGNELRMGNLTTMTEQKQSE